MRVGARVRVRSASGETMLRAVARSAGRRATSWSTAPSTSTARERAGGTLAHSPHQHRPGAHHVGTPVASSVADDPSARVVARGYAKHSRRPHRNPAPSKPASDAKSKALRPVSASWTEVADPRTGTSYWWNKATGETTGLGDPRPTTYKLPAINRGSALSRPYDRHGQPTIGLAMGQMLVFGFGGALGVTFVGVVAAWLSGGAAAQPASRETARETIPFTT